MYNCLWIIYLEACSIKSSKISLWCMCHYSLIWFILHFMISQVMPENFMFGRRAPFPLCNKHINIVVGEPIKFDLPKMRQLAISKSRDPHLCSMGWPGSDSHGMDEAARRYLYSSISDKILTIMENLRSFGRSILK